MGPQGGPGPGDPFGTIWGISEFYRHFDPGALEAGTFFRPRQGIFEVQDPSQHSRMEIPCRIMAELREMEPGGASYGRKPSQFFGPGEGG